MQHELLKTINHNLIAVFFCGVYKNKRGMEPGRGRKKVKEQRDRVIKGNGKVWGRSGYIGKSELERGEECFPQTSGNHHECNPGPTNFL